MVDPFTGTMPLPISSRIKWCTPIVSIFACACVRTSIARLDPSTQFEATCVAAVQIYTTADRVQAPFIEVALLNSSGRSDLTNEEQMLGSMREKAAHVGANGVILNSITQPSAGAKVAGSVLGVGTARTGQAVAIHIPGDSARATEACSLSHTDEDGRTWRLIEYQENARRILRIEDATGQVLYDINPRKNWRTLPPELLDRMILLANPTKPQPSP